MLRRIFTYLYMSRVAILILLTLGVFLPAAFKSPMLHGLADLQDNQIALVSLGAFLLLSASITCIFLVLLYGSERVDGKRAPDATLRPAAQLPDRLKGSNWIVIGLYVVGFWFYFRFLYAVLQTLKTGRVHPAGVDTIFWKNAAFGFVIGAVIVLIVFLLDLSITSRREKPEVEVFALPFAYISRTWAWPKTLLRYLSDLGPVRALQQDGMLARNSWFAKIGVTLLGPGYGKFDQNGKAIESNPGHAFAGMLAIACLLLYIFAGSHTYNKLYTDLPFGPQRAYDAVLLQVLLLLLLACWILAGMSFFFDRFRIPVLAPLVLILIGTSFLGPSDHAFHTIPWAQEASSLPTPAQRFSSAPDHVILVAAAGGGIQAAAWTSEVLCGLRQQIGPEFDHSVVAISGVSGGSVGLMFYLKCLESPAQDMSGADDAQASSLEAIAWGLAHPDLRRAILPLRGFWWPGADRGWALERALRKNAQFSPINRPLAETDLQKNWPVVLINSTEVRSGDPIVFTNTDFPELNPTDDRNHALHGFHLVYKNRDVELETAVRMSAAFPFVSPAARPDMPWTAEHMVDGGYFGNSGLFSLGEWIEAAAPRLTRAQFTAPNASPRKKILVLHIDAFPDSQWSGPADKPHRWFYQLYAPILAILHVRSEGQLVRDNTSGEDLLELLDRRGYDASGLMARYSPAANTDSPQAAGTIACPQDPPLTWHLTEVEKACIQQFWKDSQPELVQDVREFLSAPIAAPAEKARRVIFRHVRPGVYQQQFEKP